jgi:S1-C subfamily serine protease
MNLHFICPHCGQHLEGDVPPVGSEATCPACGMEFRVAGAVPARRHPPSRAQERKEEARARMIIFAVIAGSACVLGLIAWLASALITSRREAREAKQDRQEGLAQFTSVLKRQELWRREDDRQREQRQAVMRENSRERIVAQKAEFTAARPLAKLALTRTVFEGDSDMAEEMLREMEALYDEAIASHRDGVEGNDVDDAPVHIERHLVARLVANRKLHDWMRKRSAAEFWDRFRRDAGPDKPDANPLPDFMVSGKYRSSGTGFWISEDGFLLTNRHVADTAAKTDVRTITGKIVPSRVVATDDSLDIALLKAEHKPAVWLPLSNGEPEIGEYVFTVGFPNTLVQGVSAKFTDGRISSASGLRDDKNFYQTSVPVQMGNSGGALVHSKSGWVVGMMTLKLHTVAPGISADNVSYALKSPLLRRFIESKVPALATAINRTNAPASSAEREVITRAEQATVLVLVE